MPRELIAVGPRQPVFREYDESSPQTGEAKVRSISTTISHGTEMSLYRGTAPFATQAFDRRGYLAAEGDLSSVRLPLAASTNTSKSTVAAPDRYPRTIPWWRTTRPV